MKRALAALLLAAWPAAAQINVVTAPCSLTDGSCSNAGGGGAVGGALVVNSTASLPETPEEGMLVWVASVNRAVIYNAATGWYWADGTGRVSTDHVLEPTGDPLTPPAATGELVAGGSMTAGSHVCAVSAYNSTGGETVPGTPTAALTVGASATIRLTFTASGTGWRGKRVYCSKAGTTSPLYYVATIDDVTTGTYDVTIADGSFGVYAHSEDFSRPLPAGWTGYVAAISTSGCGATATGVVCFDSAPPNPSTSSHGVRAAYVFGSVSGNWVAQWKVERFDNGPPPGYGGSAYAEFIPVALWADVTVQAGAAIGTGLRYTFPFGAAGTSYLTNGRASRGAGGAWGFTDTNATPYPAVLSPSTVWWVRVVRNLSVNGDIYQILYSSDGQSWYSPSMDNGTSCAGADRWCSSTPMTAVGITSERKANGSGGYFMKISSFEWSSF